MLCPIANRIPDHLLIRISDKIGLPEGSRKIWSWKVLWRHTPSLCPIDMPPHATTAQECQGVPFGAVVADSRMVGTTKLETWC